MDFMLTREMQNDLREVNETFASSLRPWWNEIAAYLPEVSKDPGFNLLPAMVVAAYKSIGLEQDLTIKMANLFKTIFMANQIHVLIKDDEEGQLHNQELQFTILIGDYIFGKILKLLLEANADRLLDMFAIMIGDINEGFITRYKFDSSFEEGLIKTRGPLYQKAFLTGARLADWPQKQADIFGDIGYNLGMAMELIFFHELISTGQKYLHQAKQAWQLIKPDLVFQPDLLEAIVGVLERGNGGVINGL